MKILGIRTAPMKLRYALLEISASSIVFINKDKENQIKVPASVTEDNEKLFWQKNEIDRVLRQNQDIDLIVLKVSEYGKSDTKQNRLSSYFDAAIILSAKESGIELITKLYSQMSTRRTSVKEDAESRVGRTQMYWDEQIADAVVAAWAAK